MKYWEGDRPTRGKGGLNIRRKVADHEREMEDEEKNGKEFPALWKIFSSSGTDLTPRMTACFSTLGSKGLHWETKGSTAINKLHQCHFMWFFFFNSVENKIYEVTDLLLRDHWSQKGKLSKCRSYQNEGFLQPNKHRRIIKKRALSVSLTHLSVFLSVTASSSFH